MPTKIYAVTPSPVDLTSALTTDAEGDPLALTIGQTYQCRFQATNPQATLKILEAPMGSTVTAASPALRVRSFEDVVIKPVSGESIFVWSEDGGSLLIINDTG